MRTKHALALAAATAVLLVAALLAAGRLRTDDKAADAGPDAARTALGNDGGNDNDGGGGGGEPARKTPYLSVRGARSIAFEGLVTGMPRVDVAADELRMLGEVVDSTGARMGRGTLVADGPTTIEGPGLGVQGAFTFSPKGGTLTAPAPVSVQGHAVVSSASLRFFGNGAPRGVPVSGPVRLEEPEIDLDTATVGGDTLHLSRGTRFGRATLSWAGGGRIGLSRSRSFSGEWLGVKAAALAGTLRPQDMSLEAEFDAQQVYVDGMPQLRADKVGVDLVNGPVPVAPGERGGFDWAPRNRSSVDMAITRIRPGNAEGAWVNLALDRLPAMFGGENRVPPGGDTSGLGKRGSGFFNRSASPIDAVILPGTADREGISFDVPAGTPPGRYELVLVLEGNFEPIRVAVPVEVAPRPAT